MQHLLPAWGLTYQRHDSCATLDAAVIDLLITDDVEHLFELRPALKTPILLVTAYGNFLPNEQSLALAPLHQLARPLARNALYQTLRRTLQGHEPEHPLAIPAITQEQGRARILLVEDNPVNQLVAKGMLAKLGCQVQLATQGAEALELLAREEFDLVLMDCNMPVMDGYEASRRIRQSGRWPELPIVALTANAMPEERERCRAAGMNDYLAKPFRREELLAWLTIGCPSAAEQTLDVRLQGLWLGGGGIARDLATGRVDQKLGEVPLDLLATQNTRGALLEFDEQRVSARAVDLDLAKQRKTHAEITLAELRNVPRIARFLLAELVARKAQYHQATVAVGLPQLLQALVLRGKTALAGGIDHQQHLAREVAQRLVLAAQGHAGDVQHRCSHDRAPVSRADEGRCTPS